MPTGHNMTNEEFERSLDARLGKLYRDAVRAHPYTPASTMIVQVIDWCFANGVASFEDVAMKLIDALKTTLDARYQAALTEKMEERILEVRQDGSMLVGRVVPPIAGLPKG